MSVTSRIYIGFTDQAVEGTWVWTDGTPTGYTNWEPSPAQPDNAGVLDVKQLADAAWNEIFVMGQPLEERLTTACQQIREAQARE